MKQTTQTKGYSIAWFKIAECVFRGEKERALGVYRLLSHSLDDEALVLQLEGDILLACNDQDRALLQYYNAARVYEKDARVLQAIALYEHILLLNQRDILLRAHLIQLYNRQSNSVAVLQHAMVMIEQLLLEQKYDLLFQHYLIIISQLHSAGSARLCKTLISLMAQNRLEHIVELQNFIQERINELSLIDNQQADLLLLLARSHNIIDDR